MTDVILHDYWRSSSAYRVRIGLNLLGIPYRTVPVDLSVGEHLDLLARAHGLPDADIAVDDILHQVQLVPQSGQLPGTLSSGQRRRLAS